jgi:hypothetical protein
MGLEGLLYKKGEKGPIKKWKRRYFRQLKEQLFYFRQESETEPLGFIPLDKGEQLVTFNVPCALVHKPINVAIQRIFHQPDSELT